MSLASALLAQALMSYEGFTEVSKMLDEWFDTNKDKLQLGGNQNYKFGVMRTGPVSFVVYQKSYYASCAKNEPEEFKDKGCSAELPPFPKPVMVFLDLTVHVHALQENVETRLYVYGGFTETDNELTFSVPQQSGEQVDPNDPLDKEILVYGDPGSNPPYRYTVPLMATRFTGSGQVSYQTIASLRNLIIRHNGDVNAARYIMLNVVVLNVFG